MNILWLNTKIMFPLDQGGRIRTYHTLKYLSRRHAVAVVSLVNLPGEAMAIPAMSKVCSELHVVPFRRTSRRGSARFYWQLCRNLPSRWPFSMARYRSRTMLEKVSTILRQGLASGPVDVVVCDFLPPAVNLPRRVAVPLVLFAHNVEGLLWRRLAEGQTGRLRRRYFAAQARRMCAREADLARRAALVIAVSPDDREAFRREYGVEDVEAVPTGVDVAFYAGDEALPAEPELVFVGSMDWMPNEEGAGFLIERVLPLVRRSVPKARLTIVGKSPSVRLRKMAAAAGGVAVTGRVDDVRPYVRRARAVVVPLMVGGGTRIKIFEALAAGRPVVSTTIGAEGLPVTHGRDILIADSAPDFAEAVVEVLTDDELARHLGEAGRALVEEAFDWPRVAAAFERLLLGAVARNRPPASRVPGPQPSRR